MTTPMTRDLAAIVTQLLNEGYVEGTPIFDYVFMKRKVERCQELKRASNCRVCSYFDDCELAKSYLRQTLAFQQQAATEATSRKKAAQERAAASIGHIARFLALEEKKND